MGCDGGTIPKRDELVRTKKRPEQKDKESELAFRWRHCALSQQPLNPPVVGCELGKMYNKEAILESLLDKNGQYAESEVISHIRNLRDVKELTFTENPDESSTSTASAEKGDGYIDHQKARWICPVAGQEMNGRFRFVFIWTCGCVLSEKAMKEMVKSKRNTETSEHECLRCQKKFDLTSIITLNPTDEEIADITEKMSLRRAAAKNGKKSKKNGKNASETVVSEATATGAATGTAVEEPSTSAAVDSKTKASKRKADDVKEIPNGQKLTVPGVIAASSSNGNNSKKSKFPERSSSKASSSNPDKHSSAYSVAKDPGSSEVYKSLFTSHSKAQTQDKAHWVTYNPFYN